jgi:hypothetical protein
MVRIVIGKKAIRKENSALRKENMLLRETLTMLSNLIPKDKSIDSKRRYE